MTSGHLLLLDLVIYDMPRRELGYYILYRYLVLDHQNHEMIYKVADFVYCLPPVLLGRGNDNLRRLLPDLLENLVDSLFKEV